MYTFCIDKYSDTLRGWTTKQNKKVLLAFNIIFLKLFLDFLYTLRKD